MGSLDSFTKATLKVEATLKYYWAFELSI